MAKTTNAATVKDLRYAATVADVLDLLRYGIYAANETEFVRIVEDGEPDEFIPFTGKAKRPGARLVIWIHERQRDGHLASCRQNVEQPEVGRACLDAILAGDAEFFRQMADAVAMLKTGRIVEGGKRGAFMLLVIAAAFVNKNDWPIALEVQAEMKRRFSAGASVRQIQGWSEKILGCKLPTTKPVPPPSTQAMIHLKRQKRTPAGTAFKRSFAGGRTTRKAKQIDGIHTALKVLTVPREIIYREKRFWQRKDVEMVLLLARTCWREAAKLHHPDKGGDATLLHRFQAAFEMVRRLAKKRGFTV